MIEWEFLDKLDSANCWINGISGNLAHMDSYMTIPVYENILKVLNEEKNNYSLEEWRKIIDYCKSSVYISPNSGILAGIIQRFIFPDNQ